MTAHTAKAGRFAGLIFSACLALLLIPAQAHAVTVTVDKIAYELGSIYTSYDASPGLLESQPWWGSGPAAFDFANEFAATGSVPLGMRMFAYAFKEKDPLDDYSDSKASVYYTLTDESAVLIQNGSIGSYQNWNFVTATRSASSVPEINAGSLSQALLILLAFWLVTCRSTAARVA